LSKYSKTAADQDELLGLISKENILASQIAKLKGTSSSAPFSDLITPPNIDKIPEIHNPFEILTGLSMIKTLNANLEEYKKKKESLTNLIDELRQENKIYKKLYS